MTIHNKLVGTSNPLGVPTTYSYRYVECESCDKATDISCDDCGGFGNAPASCCVCNNVAPLDDDGYCAKCLEPTGWALAEHVAYGMVR